MITLGQLGVHSSPPPDIDPHEPRVMWADYKLSTIGGKDCIVVSWDIGSAYTNTIKLQSVKSMDDPNPVWKLDHTLYAEWFPKVVYCNVYGITHDSSPGSALHPSNAAFLGSSGLDGILNRFIVERDILPDDIWTNG